MSNNWSGEEFTDEEEAILNQPPRQYKVSFFTKCLFSLFGIFGLILYGYMVADRRYSQNKVLKYNQMAAVKLVQSSMPQFKVHDAVIDQEIDIKEAFAGSWVLLNIWATWCPPCKKEMPSLEVLQQKFKNTLKVVALSVDDDLNAVKEFIKIHHPSFNILWDQKKASSVFGVMKYPETFLISPDGLLITQFSGPRDWASPTAIEYFSDVIKN